MGETMKTVQIPAAAVTIAAVLVPCLTVAAGPKYDRTIEQAAIAIVSRKVGDIRGPLAIGAPNVLYPPAWVREAQTVPLTGVTKPVD
jgi:hypothetical protein